MHIDDCQHRHCSSEIKKLNFLCVQKSLFHLHVLNIKKKEQ